MKMLLMFPTGVIESVPAIREFLSSGYRQKSNKNVKDALQESEERNRSILAASEDSILVLNEENMVEVFNKAAETLFQYQVR